MFHSSQGLAGDGGFPRNAGCEGYTLKGTHSHTRAKFCEETFPGSLRKLDDGGNLLMTNNLLISSYQFSYQRSKRLVDRAVITKEIYVHMSS